jgi:tetratricopeptide (TPR) repeat protein/DNA-directed RNA polymerase subunit RPC12/RpoP
VRVAIQFVCPWCTQNISADETKAGTTIECPHCNRPVKVPAKPTHEPPPSLPPSSPSSADTPASGLDSAVSEPPLPPASPPQPAGVPLTRREILKAAIKERQAGKPAEEVYKTYQGQVRPNNALAMAIASVADPERKRRYAVLNYVLAALLVLVALLKALSVVMLSNLSPGLMLGAVVLGLFVPLYFAYAIARFDGRVYSLLIVLALGSALNILLEKGHWLGKLAGLVLPAAIIAVAFVAQRKIFPNMRLFRVKKGADGSYVWCDQERRFAEATLTGMPPPVTARQGILVSKRSRFLVILILIALVLFIGVIIRFDSGSIAYSNRGVAKKAKGDLDGAIADYNRAIELDPKLAIASNNRGNAEKKLSRSPPRSAEMPSVPLASPVSPTMTPAAGFNVNQALLSAQLSFYKMHSNLLNMTRWMQLRRSASGYRQISREDLRDFDAKAQNMLASIDHVLGYLPVSDQEPWRVRRALMSACSEQARLFDANWNDWHASGVKPKKGEAKPWQKEAMRLQSEIDTVEKRDKELSYNSSGAEKLKNGDVNGAITDFNQAVELDPRYANAYHNRAYAKVKKKQYAAAIEDIQRAIQLDPKNGDYYLSLGWHQLFNRKPRESIAASLKALELSPDHALIINGNLAHAYLFDNQFDKAKAIYLENKDTTLHDGRAFSQSVLDDFKEFQEAGITHPDMEKIKALLTEKSQDTNSTDSH